MEENSQLVTGLVNEHSSSIGQSAVVITDFGKERNCGPGRGFCGSTKWSAIVKHIWIGWKKDYGLHRIKQVALAFIHRGNLSRD